MTKRSEDTDGPTAIVSRSGPERPVDLDDMVTAVVTTVAGRLVVIGGPGAGERLPYYRGSNTIGRGPDNIVAIDFGDNRIHRDAHALLTVEAGVCRIHDGGKTNPVLVNGVEVSGAVAVTPSDVIEIGATSLQIEPA
jgi:pSer/pThr/pTyr-binding forkhead associated (FHA) protein